MSDPAISRARVLRFGAHELDVRAGELRKHGIRVRLGEQPFRILLMLLEHPGEVVLREDIRQRLWPNNTIVEFDPSINAAITRLRAALGETAEQPRYIETVGSRGYRFTGEVEGEPLLPPPPAPDSKDGDDLAGQTIARYKLLDELGTGGMGVVYRAQDVRLGRQAALKFLPEEVAADPIARQRFEREVRAASSLNHPNICTIYAVEESEGRLFLAMELLEGITLQARLAQGGLPRAQALSIGVQIAAALDAAHRHGIVHRDVKPANIMLTKVGVKVLDFGLAKIQPAVPAALEDASPPMAGRPIGVHGITEKGTLLGTVQYMSPEQVEGKEADPRSDIFSFGLVLYEMLAGRRAFEEPSRARLIAAILHEQPAWERLPGDLERVVRRCLAKDPEARWQSAADLRDELEFACAGRRRLRLPGKKSFAISAAAAAIFAAGLYLADPRTIDVSQVRFTPMAMEPGFNQYVAWAPDGRSFSYIHNGGLMIRSLEAPVPVRVGGPAVSSVFSEDGTRLFYTNFTGAQVGRKLWSIPITGGEAQLLPAADLGGSYMFDGITRSPDGKSIVALEKEPGGPIYRLVSSSPPGEPWRPLPYPPFEGVFPRGNLRFSPDGKQLLVTLNRVWLLDWPPVQGRPPRRIFPTVTGNGADWMTDSRHVLMHVAGKSENQGGGLFVGDTRTGRLYPLELRDSQAGQPSASVDGKFVVPYSDSDRDIVNFPLDGSPPRPLIATKRIERAADWSHGGDQLVYLSARNGPEEIWIWSPARDSHRMLVTPSPSDTLSASSPVFSPDDKHVAFASGPGAVWVIPASGGTRVRVLPAESGATLPTWSPDGQWLAYSAARGGRAFLEKVRLGDSDHPVRLAERDAGGVSPMWSPDGRWITLATKEGVSLISPDGRVTRRVYGPTTNWTSIGWSRDGKTLYLGITYCCSDAMAAKLWAVDPDTALAREIGHYSGVYFGGILSASPDGKSMTGTLVKPDVYLWLVEGLKPPQSLWSRLFHLSSQ